MRLTISFIMLMLTTLLWAANQQYSYEPEVVELNGTIRTQIFPGPPGYESVKNGDTPEKAIFLDLSHPIDVIPAKNETNELSVTEKDVNTVQVAIMNDEDWQKIKEGKKFCIQGTLFHEHTAHHHAKVLISVAKIKKC